MFTRGLILHSLPEGKLQPEHFRIINIALPDRPTLLLKPRYVSVDPYMRTRMQPEGYDYIERWIAGSLLSGWTLAEVIASNTPAFKPGELVVGHLPMQEIIASDGKGLMRIPAGSDPTAFLHPLGMTGFTAWVGMQLIGQPTEEDTVLVSAAAGAVGSIAAQLAKRSGARVIVTAGRADKRDWLRHQGFQAVLDHRHADYTKQLNNAASSGITLNFENVGGPAFKAAIEAMRVNGRIVLCGLVSQYQSDRPRQSPENFAQLRQKNISVHPFVVPHYLRYWADFQEFMAPLVAQGGINWSLDTLSGGLDSIGPALIGLLHGDNLGKRVVEIT
ncbi:MDR family NADP-dependent oxidoreductase [Vreelandella populi]|uniref:NADP-dependent oxidoreductase n=1 Tax=Vreelandella populi TaxID=2498858 RepID=A0A3S0YE48_9GAMM|nr:NADP-dependent oxidoreductase [Halomonas populi]RUR35708.1 NADP-dependent oxidoreductase [Halomonas populi]RUR47899.1 NADP-dependent oxidoreductase [Halomonas populi]